MLTRAIHDSYESVDPTNPTATRTKRVPNAALDTASENEAQPSTSKQNVFKCSTSTKVSGSQKRKIDENESQATLKSSNPKQKKNKETSVAKVLPVNEPVAETKGTGSRKKMTTPENESQSILNRSNTKPVKKKDKSAVAEVLPVKEPVAETQPASSDSEDSNATIMSSDLQRERGNKNTGVMSTIMKQLSQLKDKNTQPKILDEPSTQAVEDAACLILQSIDKNVNKLVKVGQDILSHLQKNKKESAQGLDAISNSASFTPLCVKKNMRYLGNDYWMPNELYQVALRDGSTDPNRFLKALAHVIAGRNRLAQSSITGKPCQNKNIEAKPALEPFIYNTIMAAFRARLKELDLTRDEFKKYMDGANRHLSSKCLSVVTDYENTDLEDVPLVTTEDVLMIVNGEEEVTTALDQVETELGQEEDSD